MTRTPLVLASALCLATVAGCHRNQTRAPNETVVETTTTSTTTTTTAGGDVALTPRDSMNAGMTTTYRDSTGVMRTRRVTGGGMNAERRELHLALHALTRARRELEHASHDYGGRRADALRAVDNALREVRLAAGQEASANAMAPREERRERNEIHAAVESLEHARADMEHATHDFGGRRTEVLRSVDAALRELRLAQQYES